MKKLLDLYKKNYRKFSGYVGLLGIFSGGLYAWFYKDGDIFTYMIVGLLFAGAIIAIIEKIFVD